MKIEFLNTIVHNYIRDRKQSENLDPDNSHKNIFFLNLNFCFPIDMCINCVKETCFSQRYQKWICFDFGTTTLFK